MPRTRVGGKAAARADFGLAGRGGMRHGRTMKESKSMGSAAATFVKRRVRILLVALPVACLLLLLPVEGWLSELLRHFRLWCAGLGLVLGVLALLLPGLRRWAVLGFSTAAWQGSPALPRSTTGDAANASGARLTILNANLLWRNEDPDRTLAALEAADADVIVMQEFTPEWAARFKVRLGGRFPHMVAEANDGPFGIALASRWPLEGAQVLHDPADIPCVAAVVVKDGLRCGVLGVHPFPPMRPESYEVWRDAMGAWPGMLAKLDAPHKVLSGDLNATPWCRAWGRLIASTGLRRALGAWPGRSTWHPGPLPWGLPLDHVLVSGGLAILSHDVSGPTGSDHRQVKVTVAAANASDPP